LDTLAADAVLAWKYLPARNAKGETTPTQVQIEIPFKIEGVPAPKEKKK